MNCKEKLLISFVGLVEIGVFGDHNLVLLEVYVWDYFLIYAGVKGN